MYMLWTGCSWRKQERIQKCSLVSLSEPGKDIPLLFGSETFLTILGTPPSCFQIQRSYTRMLLGLTYFHLLIGFFVVPPFSFMGFPYIYALLPSVEPL